MSLVSNGTIYYVNSANRTDGTDSDFSCKIDIPVDSKYDRVCVLQMSIPKSYYVIQANESFMLHEGKSSVNIIIPVGNYTRKSFSTVVQGLLNTNSPNGYTYAITYPTSATSADTGKYSFAVVGNSGVQPSFVFATSNDIAVHLGFALGSTNSFVTNTLTSTQTMNLQAETTLFLHSSICHNGQDNVLQEVFSVGSSDFSYVTFQQQCIEGYSKNITSDKNNTYRFTLTDENGTQMDLNGQNINITLLVYRKNDLYEMIKQFLKLKTMQT